jgi:hypothetical protein
MFVRGPRQNPMLPMPKTASGCTMLAFCWTRRIGIVDDGNRLFAASQELLVSPPIGIVG